MSGKWAEYMNREGWQDYLCANCRPMVEAKVKQMVEAEREACAQLAQGYNYGGGDAGDQVADNIATAIRARGASN